MHSSKTCAPKSLQPGARTHFFRVWVRALARVRSRTAVAKQHSAPRVTNHSCPPLDRGVSALLLSEREGFRPDFSLGTHFLGLKPGNPAYRA